MVFSGSKPRKRQAAYLTVFLLFFFFSLKDFSFGFVVKKISFERNKSSSPAQMDPLAI